MFPSVICALERTRNVLSCGPWGKARRACLETTTDEEGPEVASGEDAKIYDAEVRDERLHRSQWRRAAFAVRKGLGSPGRFKDRSHEMERDRRMFPGDISTYRTFVSVLCRRLCKTAGNQNVLISRRSDFPPSRMADDSSGRVEPQLCRSDLELANLELVRPSWCHIRHF